MKSDLEKSLLAKLDGELRDGINAAKEEKKRQLTKGVSFNNNDLEEER